MKTQITEIRLIQNKSKNQFRITVNGKDEYIPFTYTDDTDNETDVRRIVKAIMFDEIMLAQLQGKKFHASYDIF